MAAASPRMLATLHSSPNSVFGDSYLELLTLAVLVSAFATAYKHIECHQTGCHRLGDSRMGTSKLCARHHPLVPKTPHQRPADRRGDQSQTSLTHARASQLRAPGARFASGRP